MNRGWNAYENKSIDWFSTSLPLEKPKDGYIRRRANLGALGWNRSVRIKLYAMD